MKEFEYFNEPFFRFLDTAGDGTGTKNAIGNYSAAVTNFYIQPPAGSIYVISRIIAHIADTGGLDAGSYGNGITLTNGVDIETADGTGTIIGITDGIPIKTNGEWARYCYDVQYTSFGTGLNYLNVRWSFFKTGSYIRIDGSKNELLKVILNDDFTDLDEHYFMVQGYIEGTLT